MASITRWAKQSLLKPWRFARRLFVALKRQLVYREQTRVGNQPEAVAALEISVSPPVPVTPENIAAPEADPPSPPPAPEIITPPAPQWHEVTGGPLQGYHLLLDLTSIAHWQQEMQEGRYDAFLYEILKDHSPLQGATIWDVGAHIGYHTLAFAALVGHSGQVVAFEPNPHNFARLQQHLDHNQKLAQRITLLPCALSNLDGEGTLLLSKAIEAGASSGSHLTTAYAPAPISVYAAFEEQQIAMATADTLIREQKLPVPALLKIDVEGAEAAVLAGATTLLTGARPTLLVEVHHVVAMHELTKVLFARDYTIEIIQHAPMTPARCFIVARPTPPKLLH